MLAATALITMISSGVDRVFSPLSHQGGGRRLQVESVAATPFVLPAWLRWELREEQHREHPRKEAP